MNLRRNGCMYNILVCDDEKDIVSALEIYLKADDHRIFQAYNGMARVRSHLRRYMRLGSGTMPSKDVLVIGGIELNDLSKQVFLDGKEISLTPTEYDILLFLMQNPGVVYSPAEIYRNVWKEDPYGTENIVAVHVRHLREKLEYDPASPRYLKSVWGRGYKMEGK